MGVGSSQPEICGGCEAGACVCGGERVGTEEKGEQDRGACIPPPASSWLTFSPAENKGLIHVARVASLAQRRVPEPSSD